MTVLDVWSIECRLSKRRFIIKKALHLRIVIILFSGCLPPTITDPQLVILSQLAVYPDTFPVIFDCNPGFSLMGSLFLTCNASAGFTFPGDLPVCNPSKENYHRVVRSKSQMLSLKKQNRLAEFFRRFS